MTVNVMGASGQLGQKVLKHLLKYGVQPGDLIASARTPEKVANFRNEGVDVRQANYDDVESLKNAFQDTDILVVIPSIEMVEKRILQLFNTIVAAKITGVKRIVYSSFQSALTDSVFHVAPFIVYAETKIRQSGIDWTILRNGMYIDPIGDWIPELKKLGRIPYPVKEGKVSYIAREDLARATAAVCLDNSHAGKIYSLTGPDAVSMEQLAGILTNHTGNDIVFESVSEEEYADVCRDGNEEVPEELIVMLISLYRAVDNGELDLVTDHVQQITGNAPLSVEQYLEELQK